MTSPTYYTLYLTNPAGDFVWAGGVDGDEPGDIALSELPPEIQEAVLEDQSMAEERQDEDG